MSELKFSLHPGQIQVFTDPARFKVVAAGRRFGKSFLARVTLIVEALKMKNEFGYDLKDKDVWYIAPTFQQGKDTQWHLLKEMCKDVTESTLENTACITLKNGRRIQIKGSDRPDTLRGVGLSYAVLDEFAFMKPEVWELIISPTLTEVKGSALFIGTPDGKNHFFDLWDNSNKGASGDDWKAFHFNSTDNPFLPQDEIEKKKNSMSVEAYNQEFAASFSSAGSGAFKLEDIQYYEIEPDDGYTYIAVDPNGFSEEEGMVKSSLMRLDECAIAVVKVCPTGWYVKDIISGRWGIREASLQILKAAKKYGAIAVGIEKGSLKNAIMPYLEDQMRRLGVYPRVEPLSHGGKKKTERIMWSLQGRFQHGRIFFKKSDWNRKVIDQLLDFPNPLVHDDLIDALSYIDQIAVTSYDYGIETDNWEPLDAYSGW